MISLAVVAVLAVVVVVGVVVSTSGDGEQAPAPISLASAAATYPTSVSPDGVVVAGRPRTPHTIDVYEDPLCPICGQFEQGSGGTFASALAAGRVQVRYHELNLLEQRSNPPGYSLDAANALVCSAENGAFPLTHATLFASQPEEGGTGHTVEQLVDVGQRAGAGPGYADCVRSARHAPQVRAAFARAQSDPALTRPSSSGGRSFGTPTILVDGKMLAPGSRALTDVLG